MIAHPELDGPRKSLAESIRTDAAQGPQSGDEAEPPGLIRRLRQVGSLLDADETPGQLRKVGPSLRHVASKVDYEFLVRLDSQAEAFPAHDQDAAVLRPARPSGARIELKGRRLEMDEAEPRSRAGLPRPSGMSRSKFAPSPSICYRRASRSTYAKPSDAQAEKPRPNAARWCSRPAAVWPAINTRISPRPRQAGART